MTDNNDYKNELPAGWVWTSLQELAEFKNGINFRKNERGKGILTVDVLNMYSKSLYVDLCNLYRVNKEINDEYRLKYGDILFVRSSVKREGVGWASLFQETTEPVTFCGFLIRARLQSEEINLRYMGYFLRSHFARNRLVSGSSQVTITNINQKTLGRLPIPVPPFAEQHRIVAKIEELFSDLDHSVAALETVQAQLKTYRQAVLKYAFEGKLTGNNREKWEESRIKDVFELIDGDRGRNYPKRNDYSDTGYCLFLSTKNVRPNGFEFHETVFISEEKHKILRKGTLERGDIVLTTRGTIGNVALYDDSVPFDVVRINSGMLILRLKREDLFRQYLIYFIQSPLFDLQIKQKRSGTAQPQLPARILKEFDISIPPEKEQHAIVEEIEARLSVIDKLEETIATSLQQAEALRQSILKQAFAGQLVPQDPNDEPAEMLLARIQTQRVQ